jgi:hypothetical protein
MNDYDEYDDWTDRHSLGRQSKREKETIDRLMRGNRGSIREIQKAIIKRGKNAQQKEK